MALWLLRCYIFLRSKREPHFATVSDARMKVGVGMKCRQGRVGQIIFVLLRRGERSKERDPHGIWWILLHVVGSCSAFHDIVEAEATADAMTISY